MSLKVQHGGDPRRDGYCFRIVLQKQDSGVSFCSVSLLDGIEGRLKGGVYSVPNLRHGIGNTLEGIGVKGIAVLHIGMAAGGDGLFQILMVNFIVPDSACCFPGHILRRRNGGRNTAVVLVKRRMDKNIVALLVGPVVLDDTAGDGEMAVKIVHRILITAFDSTGHPHTAAIVNAIVACDLTAADGNIRSINAAQIPGDLTAGDFHDAALDADTAIIPDFAAADNHGSFLLIGPIEAGAVIIDAAAAVAADRSAGHPDHGPLMGITDAPPSIVTNVSAFLNINCAVGTPDTAASVVINLTTGNRYCGTVATHCRSAVFCESAAGNRNGTPVQSDSRCIFPVSTAGDGYASVFIDNRSAPRILFCQHVADIQVSVHIQRAAPVSGVVIPEGAARNHGRASSTHIYRAAAIAAGIILKGAAFHGEGRIVVEKERSAIGLGIFLLGFFHQVAGNGAAQQCNLVLLRRKVESAAIGVSEVVLNGHVPQFRLKGTRRVQCAAAFLGAVLRQRRTVKIRRGRSCKVQRAVHRLTVLNAPSQEARIDRFIEIRRAAIGSGSISVPEHVGKICRDHIPAVQAAAMLRRLIAPEGDAAEGHLRR